MYSTTRVLCSVDFFPQFIITLTVLGRDFFHHKQLDPYCLTHTQQITIVLVIKFDISIFIYSSAQQPSYRIIMITRDYRDDVVERELK